MRVLRSGMELDENEQLIWAKANTRANNSLSADHFRAIITEHTDPIDNDPEKRKIPIEGFERASEMLGWLAGRYREILDSSVLPADHFAVIETEALIKNASDLKTAIADNIATS